MFLHTLKKRYYQELKSHIKNKVKVELRLSNYATKKELKHVADADTCNLAAKTDFFALKVKVDKVDIIKLVYVWTSFNKLKAKVNDLDVDELKTVSIYLKN